MGNTAGKGMCACSLFTSAWTGNEKKITWNHENQENQKNQEDSENHENHKNQKYTITGTKSYIMWSPIA